MKGAIIPAAFPRVSCIPLATARLPYRGQLLGSHASGIPTQMYNPAATRKQLQLIHQQASNSNETNCEASYG